MKPIIWLIEERELPGVGTVSPGKEYNVNADLAANLIKQGDAAPAKKKKAKVA